MATGGQYDFTEASGGVEVSIDSKGRVLLPKPVRALLGSKAVICRGQNGGIALYPEPVWADLKRLVDSFPLFDPSRREYERLVTGGAKLEECDGSDRLLLPQDVRSFAGLDSGTKAKVIGMTGLIELWSPSEYESYSLNPTGYRPERRAAVEAAYRQLMQGAGHARSGDGQ